jgi:biopolymer transport protein ExbB
MDLLQINVVKDTVQTVSQIAGQAAEAGNSLSFWDMTLKGGWMMAIIFLFSVWAVYIFVERLLVINKVSKKDEHFMEKIKDYIKEGKIEEAIKYCDTYDHPIARMIKKGILRLGKPVNDIYAAIENVGALEVAKLEKGLPGLATTAGVAPMLGFLGTVLGMIRAFYDMANVEGGNISVQVLSNGIYTAMVTTVAGLTVGILAYLAYNFLVAKVEKVVHQMEAATTEFMDLLNAPAE